MKDHVKEQFMTADEVAEILGTTPTSLRRQAAADPRKLGFPICMIGSSVWIPREGFQNWMIHGTPWVTVNQVSG